MTATHIELRSFYCQKFNGWDTEYICDCISFLLPGGMGRAAFQYNYSLNCNDYFIERGDYGRFQKEDVYVFALYRGRVFGG